MTSPTDGGRFWRRPDGRLRSSFWLPVALFLLVVLGIAWQSGHMP